MTCVACVAFVACLLCRRQLHANAASWRLLVTTIARLTLCTLAITTLAVQDMIPSPITQASTAREFPTRVQVRMSAQSPPVEEGAAEEAVAVVVAAAVVAVVVAAEYGALCNKHQDLGFLVR
jgi:hypothetical protein